MAYYLVSAKPKEEKLDQLRDELGRDAFIEMRPFGQAITKALKDARRAEDGGALWEEEDYCSPPLAMEREAVLDDYFEGIEVEQVECGEGWRRIDSLPSLL